MSGKSEPFSRKKVCTLHSNYIHIPNTLCLQVMLWICFLFFFWSVKQLMSTYLSCTRPTEIKLAIIQPTKQKKNNKTWKIKGLHCHWTSFFIIFLFLRTRFLLFVRLIFMGRARKMPTRTTATTMKIPRKILSRKFTNYVSFVRVTFLMEKNF